MDDHPGRAVAVDRRTGQARDLARTEYMALDGQHDALRLLGTKHSGVWWLRLHAFAMTATAAGSSVESRHAPLLWEQRLRCASLPTP